MVANTEHEATVSMFVLFLRSGGSVCGRTAARPVADAHSCTGANEGWAQGGAPHGQVGDSLLAYSSVGRKKKGGADFLLPFNWLLLSACLSLSDTLAALVKTTRRHLQINNKRVTLGVIPTPVFISI